MKRIVLVGGGSGGHFYPLIAVAEELNAVKAQGFPLELYYMGPDPYNSDVLNEKGIKFVSCPSGKKRKYFSLLNYLDIFKVIYGFFVAIVKLYIIYPDVIFSKGSYTSVPVTVAGYLLRIPIVIHESDSKPGSANKLAARFARYIAVSFDEAAKYFPSGKVALTGIPLRREVGGVVADPIQALGLPAERPIIFVTGGSFGAERLNNLILDSLDELLPTYTIFHQSGSAHETTVQQTSASLITNIELLEHYFVKGTLTGEEMGLALAASSLVIGRAGAGTIFEIAAKGKPSILIPIPENVSHDQKTNAYEYARAGGASVLEEHNLTDGLLASEINRIMGDPGEYARMSSAAQAFAKNDAARTIGEALIGISQEHG
jgi:UDP-N-acetylglucosamine--N-acetylmuramyl-(pentapeptide) pyrophosphoryl-undecaprenol N-acetylglucosamine transferase